MVQYPGKESPGGLTRTVFVDGLPVGREGELVIMAGPCAVESRDQVEAIARVLTRAGVPILRAGAFKPRTSPFSFQGLGEEGLVMLRSVADQYGLRIVSELMDTAQLDAVAKCADLIQVGARSMFNTCLLSALGKKKGPVLLKRNFSGSLDEFLMAAEYIVQAGCDDILLCERGIRTFERSTRYTLDLSAVPVLKQRSRFPVVVDPCHAAGDATLVPALAKAAVAAGADALLIEVHPKPEEALCDARQALTIEQFEDLIPSLYRIRNAARDRSRRKGEKQVTKRGTVKNPHP